MITLVMMQAIIRSQALVEKFIMSETRKTLWMDIQFMHKDLCFYETFYTIFHTLQHVINKE